MALVKEQYKGVNESRWTFKFLHGTIVLVTGTWCTYLVSVASPLVTGVLQSPLPRRSSSAFVKAVPAMVRVVATYVPGNIEKKHRKIERLED